MVRLEELDDPSPPDSTVRIFQDGSTLEGYDQNALESTESEDKFPGNVSRRLSSDSLSSLSSRGSTDPTTIGSDSASRAGLPSSRSLEPRTSDPEHAFNQWTYEPLTLEAQLKYESWDLGFEDRQPSSFSDLVIPQCEKSGASQRFESRRSGAECKPIDFETPLLRVSRSVSACQRCRNRKDKCDGKLPACTACVRVKKAATSASTSDQLASGRDGDGVTLLEDRIKALQEQTSKMNTRDLMGIAGLSMATDSPGVNVGSELRPIHTLTSCRLCQLLKIRCDSALPRCEHCEWTDNSCEYFDAANYALLTRMHILKPQNLIKEVEDTLEQWRSGDSPLDVVPKAPLGAFHSPALDVTDDRTLDEKITKTRLSSSDDALEDKTTRRSKGGNETTFPQGPSTSTNSLEGNALKVRYRTVLRPLSVFNEDLHVARKATLHQSDKIWPQKLVELVKTHELVDLLLHLSVSKQYSISRIHNALNLCIPVTLLDRPKPVPKLADTFCKQSDKVRFVEWRQTKFIVVYDAASELPSEFATSVSITLNNFKNEGYQGETLALRGDYHTFASMIPEMVDNRPASAINYSRRTIEPPPDTTVSKRLIFKDKSSNNRLSEEELASLSVVKLSTAVDSLSAGVANVDKEAAEEMKKGLDSHEMGRFPQILENQLSENSVPIGCAGKPTDESTPTEVAKSMDLAATHGEPSPSNGVNEIDSTIQIHTTALHPKRRHGASRLGIVSPWGTICKHVLFQAVLVAIYIHQYLNERDLAKFMKRAEMMYSFFYAVYLGIEILMRRRYMAKLRLSLAKMASVDSRLNASRVFHVLYGQEYTVANSAKRYVERLTAEQWDWWPLNPSFRPLHPDEVRIEWECESGHTHWSEFSKEKVRQMGDSLGENSTGHRAASSSSDDSGSLGSQSSDGRSSPATTDTSFSVPPSDGADSENNGSSEQGANPPGDEVAVNIVPPSNMYGYIMFGVQGSKRLQSSQTRLAQIDVKLCKDDDSFFDEMKIQYKQLRGYLRWIFSIWVFHSCEFIMFYRANPNEIMPGPEEMPPVTDMNYRFSADRYPPILSSVFNASFYGCNKACIKARLDLMSIFHECKGRNHCGKYRILERLPKRQRKWSIDSDEEKEEAWGLHVTFGVSFYKVALYHLLILAGPTTFWGLWLRSWPTDWQNASVPFFGVAVLLSLFWLPFAHNAGSKEKSKRKIA